MTTRRVTTEYAHNEYNVNNYGSFANAVTAIGANTATLTVSQQINITSNQTVASNITLKVLPGGSFNISAGATLTINGPFVADFYQVFSGSGDVRFGNGYIREVYPQWWGAVGDGSTDCTTAIQAAIDSLSTFTTGLPMRESCGGKIFIPTGQYKITDTISSYSSITVEGAGAWSTEILVYGTVTDAFSVAGGDRFDRYTTQGALRFLRITATGTGATVNNLVRLNSCYGYVLDKVSLETSSQYCLYIHDSIDIQVFNSYCTAGTSAGLYVGVTLDTVSTTLRFYNCYFNTCTDGPGANVAGLGIAFHDCIFESNGTNTASLGHGVIVRYGTATFHSCYWENNGGYDGKFGTEWNDSYRATVGITNPTVITGGYRTAGMGGFYFQEVFGGYLVGGTTGDGYKSLTFEKNAHNRNFTVAGVYVNDSYPPEYIGDDIRNYPGSISYISFTGNQTRFYGKTFDFSETSSAAVLTDEANNYGSTFCTIGSQDIFSNPTTISGFHSKRSTILSLNNGPDNPKFQVDTTGDVILNRRDNNFLAIRSISEEITIDDAATTYATDAIIPSGTLVLGVHSYVNATISGVSTFSLGVDGAANRYGNNLLAIAGSEWKGIENGISTYTADTPLLITPNTTPSTDTGRVTATIYYINIGASN